MNLLILLVAVLLCAVTQQPIQLSVRTAADAYVRQIDADKTLITKQHVHTYGHADKPGADSLFWAYSTDFPGSSIVAYFSGGKIVKLVETARTDRTFSEYSYYLRNGKLLFVKNRQVDCSTPTQIAALRNHTPPCTKATDCFFRGTYYFVQDSCISKQESGKLKWAPEYKIPGGGGRWATMLEFFPLQAARYLAVFGKAPAGKK